jgi:hypothetical protein
MNPTPEAVWAVPLIVICAVVGLAVLIKAMRAG